MRFDVLTECIGIVNIAKTADVRFRMIKYWNILLLFLSRNVCNLSDLSSFETNLVIMLFLHLETQC